ncbi:hypothetical protein AHF37_06342, partial [Paragonimus kellicotti]
LLVVTFQTKDIAGKHRVTKPRGSIRRLLQSHYANGWQTYGRPVWDAQPLVYLVNTGRTTKNFGYRLAPRHRPILLTQATESQRAACVAASKLLLRLVHLPEQPIMEQFLMGSYLYQLLLRLVHLPEQPIMEQFLMGSYLYQLVSRNQSTLVSPQLWGHGSTVCSCCVTSLTLSAVVGS